MLINVSELTFAYDGSYDNVFENAGFNIDTSWRLGLIGRNGRGKTTLLRLLMGELEFSGHISADVDFEYFPYAVKDADKFAVDVIRDACPWAEDWKIMRETNLSEDALWRPFNTLSNGEQTKLLLSALFLKDNAFALIDEPTNHLDADSRRALGEYLKKKSGFILVSHDRELLDTCVDHILSINRSDIEVINGNFSTWAMQTELKESFERTEQAKLKKSVDKLAAASKQAASWSDKTEKSKYGAENSKADKGFIGHKAAKMMKRAKGLENRREKELEDMKALLKNAERQEALKLHPLEDISGRLVELRDVCVRYGDSKINEAVSFEIVPGDRIALCGKNGSGKSSILKLILGEGIDCDGTVYKSSRLKISYAQQDTSGLSGTLDDYARKYGTDITLFKTILRKLGFDRAQFEKDISDLSAGQRKKVTLARSLSESAHLYIWDEPLNYIDVISRMQIEKLIIKYRPTLLFVEHDAVFVKNVATKAVTL